MKKEILETSLKQFLKYGIREMSIQKLVEPLGISSKTVYKYFKNKEELLEDALHLYHSRRYEIVENLSSDENVISLFFDIWYTAVEVTYRVNKAFFSDLNYYYPELEKKMAASTTTRYSEKFILIIRRGIEEGVFNTGTIPEVSLQGIFILYTSIVREDKFKHFSLSSYDVFLNTISVYIRGLCTARGVQELDEYIRTYKTSGGALRAKKKMAADRHNAIQDTPVKI